MKTGMENRGLKIRAQGRRGTCSVFAFTAGVEYALSRKTACPRLSIEYLNWASNRATRNNYDGSFFSQLTKGLEQYGACREDQWYYQKAFDPDAEPSPEALKFGEWVRNQGLKFHWVKENGRNEAAGLDDQQFLLTKNLLAQGWPVMGGFRLPKQWRTIQNGVLDMFERDEIKWSGAHSLLIVGYRDDPSLPGGGAFMIRDSGNKKYYEMCYAYVRSYVLDTGWIDL